MVARVNGTEVAFGHLPIAVGYMPLGEVARISGGPHPTPKQAPDATAGGALPLQLEPSKAARKRCQGVTKNGTACTAWATEGGLCFFHANPDKAAELGRNGGRRRKHTYEQATEPVAPPESAADVKRMLAETMADVKAGRMDPKVANAVAYVGTVLLRAYEADAAHTADTPTRPYVPLIYRALSTLVQKFTNVFWGFLGAARVAYPSQKLCKILASKFPLERFSLVLPVVLKIEEAFGDGVEVGEVVRG